MSLKTRIVFAFCYLLAAIAVSFPMISFFWPSLIGVFVVSFVLAPYMPANSILSRTVKSLYFAVIVLGFGWLLGGVIFSMLSIMTAKEPLDIWALIGGQLAFGSLGALVVFPFAVVAYFIATSMAKIRLLNGI